MSVAAQAEGHTQCLAVTAGGARLFFLLSGPNRASGVTVPNKFFLSHFIFWKKSSGTFSVARESLLKPKES